MLEVHYFASLRERFGREHEQLDWNPEMTNLDAVRRHLFSPLLEPSHLPSQSSPNFFPLLICTLTQSDFVPLDLLTI